MPTKYDAVIFDLLTALLDSWSLWNDVAVEPKPVWYGGKRILR